MAIQNLTQFCEQFQEMLACKPALHDLLAQGRDMLSQLVSKPAWFSAVLSDLILDESFLSSQRQSVDPNEIQLYFSPDKSFSVRAFVWEPGVTYPIHDHGAWGIVGAQINHLQEIKYARLDDGSKADYASLKQVTDHMLSPGGTTFVLPVNDGIHQMQAINDLPAVSIHVYGQPMRKGYINCFDLDRNTVTRLYPPAIFKKVLAIRTLGSIRENWAQDIVKAVMQSAEPDYILEECRYIMDKQKNKL